MKRRRPPHLFANPFSLWTAFASTAGEMLLASSEVIAHRSHLIARAGTHPRAADQRELKRMVDEKTKAAFDSATAMSSRSGQVIHASAAQMFSNMATSTSILLDLAGGRIGQAQSRAWRQLIGQSSENASQLSNAAAQIAQAGIAPYHKGATGNAKRLRKR